MRGSAELGYLVAESERGDKAPNSVHSQSPDRVAARLWPPRRMASTFASGYSFVADRQQSGIF
jgi:hypothetical protein